MRDNLIHATDGVTTALTDDELDVVAGGWLALVAAVAGTSNASPVSECVAVGPAGPRPVPYPN
jgi:hypothetical protein